MASLLLVTNGPAGMRFSTIELGRRLRTAGQKGYRGQIIKKPKKPKKPKESSSKGRVHLGNWFDESEKPNAKPIRKVPSLGGAKPSKKR